MNKLIRFSKRALLYVLRRMPVINTHHYFRYQSDVIVQAAALLEQGLARGKQNSILLTWRLRWLGLNFRGLPQAIRDNVLFVVSGRHPTREQVKLLQNQLSSMASSDLACEHWLRLNECFCFRGRYQLAQVCREHARALAILPFFHSTARPPISWANSIAAALEGGECADHDVLDLILNKANIKGLEATKWHLLLSLLNGEAVPEYELPKFDNTSYHEFVKGGKISVIGPAPAQARDATEIDSSDVVIRLNHSFSGKGTDSAHKGLRTDVSCFNGGQTRAFIEGGGILPAEITWASLKVAKQTLEVQALNAEKKCRTLVTFQGMTFHGSYNMVPLVVMDLAIFARNSIKIFHTDLMLTTSRFKGYYPPSYKRDFEGQHKFFRGSVAHDPVLQYRTLHSLWKNKKIHGDQSFEKVMAMGLGNYLKELERVYVGKTAHPMGSHDANANSTS